MYKESTNDASEKKRLSHGQTKKARLIGPQSLCGLSGEVISKILCMVQNLGQIWNLGCHKVPLLAFFQRLVECLAVGDVVLGLAALQELFDLPGAGPSWLAWRYCRGRCWGRGASGEHPTDGAACNLAH